MDDVVIEKIDYESALYILNLEHPTISEKIKKELANESYVVYTNVGSELMYDLADNSSKIYYPICKYKFYQHCMKYDTDEQYIINFYTDHLVHPMNQEGSEKIYEEILEIEDKEELYVLSKFITSICCFGSINGVDLLAQIIKYFKIDYQNEEWKLLLTKICDYDFSNNYNKKEWYEKVTILKDILYRMSLEHDNDILELPIFENVKKRLKFVR